MTPQRRYALILGGLGAAAVMVAGLGYAAPQIRNTWVFGPRRVLAQNAVTAMANKEIDYRRRKGRFDVFSPAVANEHLHALGVLSAPSEFYLFDASVVPTDGLRLRALPRGDQVLALKVGAQIYVKRLTASGAVAQQGWTP